MLYKTCKLYDFVIYIIIRNNHTGIYRHREDQCADMLTKARSKIIVEEILEEVTNITVKGSIKHSILNKEKQPHK